VSGDLALRAVLKALALPPGLFVVLLLLAVMAWRSFLGRFLAVLTAALIYLLSTGFAAGWLALGLEVYPPVTAAQLREQGVQALVVLMAGRQTGAPEYGGRDTVSRFSMDRIAYAVALHRRTGLPIILSGGRAGADGPPLAELGREVLEGLFDVQPLAVEVESANTWENATGLAALLAERRIGRVAAVTHAWHMRRALYSLQLAGIDAVAAPTYFVGDTDGEFSWRDWLPSINALHDSTHLLHEYLGGWWYRAWHGPLAPTETPRGHSTAQ
jgi:uncharacterized SAM-binding protein YcdF (DUF218 family)